MNDSRGVSKSGKLAKNIVLFTISSFGTKILAFVLVPFYTSYLTAGEYGTIDIITTTAALLLPIFTANIYDAVMRFTLDDVQNVRFFVTGIRITIIGGAILSVLAVVIGATVRDIPKEYLIWGVGLHFCNAFYNLYTNYMRAVDRVNVVMVASLLNSGILMTLNILFIAVLHLGISGYFAATLIALILSIGYMTLQYRKIAPTQQPNRTMVDRRVLGEMLRYSIPLIFTAVAWWVNSSLDRYFVTLICGVAANGIYSVSYKIPTILSVFQNIFSQAWAISAATEFDADDCDGFFGKTYNTYGGLMILWCMVVMLFNKPISRLLYANEFYTAWKYVPYLLVATLFSAMAGYLGGIFSAVKKPAVTAYTTVASAFVNAVLNFVLIPLWGVSGAAIATLFAYFVSWVIRLFVSRRYIRIKSGNTKIVIACGVLIVQMFCAVTDSSGYFIQIILIVVNTFVLRKVILEILYKVRNTVKYRIARK